MMYFGKDMQTGRSMVEVMGYMVVSMFLIAGVAKIVTGAYSEYKTSQGSLQIADFAATIVKASAADASYTDTVNIINGGGTDLQKIERERLIPRSFRKTKDIEGNNKIYNVFGGEVQVSVPSSEYSYSTDHPGDQFAIQFSGLDREQCIALMTKEWSNNRVVDLYAIVLNGTDYWYWPIYHPNENNKEHTLPVKVAEVAGTGGEGADANGLCGGDNIIMWVFN